MCFFLFFHFPFARVNLLLTEAFAQLMFPTTRNQSGSIQFAFVPGRQRIKLFLLTYQLWASIIFDVNIYTLENIIEVEEARRI